MIEINKIYNKDCIQIMNEMKKNNIFPDVIFADPPYNLSKSKKLKMQNSNKLLGFGGDWKITDESWDNMSFDEYWEFTESWLNSCKQIMKESSSIWISGTYHNIGIINVILQKLEFEILNEIIWYKRNAFPNLSGKRLTASHETILWAHLKSNKNLYTFNYEKTKNTEFPEDKLKQIGKQMRTVWDIPNNKKKSELQYKHPTQKPERLIERILLISAKNNDLIFDPFGGSFTTSAVAKKNHLNYISCDSNKEYYKIGVKRLCE